MLAAAQPFPLYFDTDGSPLDGGLIYYGASGAFPQSSPVTVYWDAAGTQPAAQPIPTMAGYPVRAGAPAAVYISGDYSVQVLNRRGQQVVYCASALTADSSLALQAQITALSQTVAGGLSVIVGDGATNNAAAVSAANALGKPILFVGVSVIGSPVTITAPIVDTTAQIFSTGSQITIANGNPVRPEWFGSAAGNIRLAVNALPSTGGVVQLRDAQYPPSYNTFTAAKFVAGTNVAGVDYLAKPNVRIQGAKLPTYKATMFGLERGTIIQGPFHAHADGFSIDLVGVDSGSDVCSALYGGVEQEALVIGQVSQPSPTYVTGVSVGRVRGLCKSPSALMHAVLIEAIDGGSVEYAQGAYAFHGVVIKSRNLQIGTLSGLETGSESVICKSDSYAPMGSLQIAEVDARSLDGTNDAGFGLLIDAVSSSSSSVQVGTVRVTGKANGVGIRSNGAVLSDVSIGSVVADHCDIGILFSGDVRRVRVGSATVLNSVFGVHADDGVTSPTVSIGDLKIANATDGINLKGLLSVDDASFESCSGYAVNYTTVAARLMLGTKRFGSSVAAFWNQQPPLSGAWVNEGSAGSPPFIVSQSAGRITMSGWVKGGASAALCTLTTQTCPPYSRAFKVAGMNGATQVTVTVRIDAATGAVTIPDYASAPTYIALDGVEWDT